MKINETIKLLRIKKNLTQQSLADLLNVSAPAVNKWEKGISYPDITLLPILARTLDTDINTLLSFKENLTVSEIAYFLNELSSIKDFDSAYQKVMGKINEYPSCEELILNSMIILQGMAEMKNLDKDYLFLPYFERLQDSKDPNIRTLAIQMLVNDKINKKQYDEANQLIQSLPKENQIKKKRLECNVQLANKDYDKACRLCEEMIFADSSTLVDSLLLLHEIYLTKEDYDMCEYISNIIEQTSRLFQGEFAAHSAKMMEGVHQKDIKKTLGSLKKIIKACKQDPYDRTLYKHIQIKKQDGSLASMFLDMIKQDKQFDYIKEDDEYKKIMDDNL